MSPQLISRSPDLKRLQDEGHDIEVRGGHLLIHRVPYVNAEKKVKRATLASTLALAGDRTTTPDTHVALFTGDQPCNIDGTPITAIQHQAISQDLGNGLVARYSFSNRPKPSGYPNYYDKMKRYMEIISNPAAALDPSASPATFPPIPTDTEDDTPFHYVDTASSRAGIAEITNKFRSHKVAIIGVGGTGSYVLDLVAKTPVKEIHIFDSDDFLTHNAFRAPGAPSLEELRQLPKKVNYLAAIYSKMHKKVIPHDKVTEDSQLAGMTFAFVCVDKGRRALLAILNRLGLEFVDVGMGVQIVSEKATLIGTLRVTAKSARKSDHLERRIPVGEGDDGGDYATNIQIADLNALNAALAVVKWKKMCGFYQDLELEHHSTFAVNANALTNEESA